MKFECKTLICMNNNYEATIYVNHNRYLIDNLFFNTTQYYGDPCLLAARDVRKMATERNAHNQDVLS